MCISMCAITTFMSVLLLTLPYLQATVTNPPWFNGALEMPVYVDPAEAFCGLDSVGSFCESLEGEGSVLACEEAQCDMSCPYSSIHQVSDASSWSGAGVTSCVTRTTFDEVASDGVGRAEHQDDTSLIRFVGSGGNDCSFQLNPGWMVHIPLTPFLQITVSFWIWPEDDTRQQTIFQFDDEGNHAVYRLYMENHQIKFTSGASPSTVYTADTWKVEPETWTAVHVQFYNDTMSVFFNATFVFPAIQRMDLLEPGNCHKYMLGADSNGQHSFHGYMQTFKVYLDGLSNREIQISYDQTAPSVRILNQCPCPPSHPSIRTQDTTYCEKNPTEDVTDSSSIYRLKRASHPLEFINDNKHDTFWISNNIHDDVTVDVHLGNVYQVVNLTVLFYSPFPEVFEVQRLSPEDGITWLPWQYYSQDCLGQMGMQTQRYPDEEDDVICSELYSGNPSYTNGEILFELWTQSRVPSPDDSVSSTFLSFSRTAAVRFVMRGNPLTHNTRHNYHGIKDVQVNVRCECNGRARECLSPSIRGTSYTCACDAGSHSHGNHCESCDTDSYVDVVDSTPVNGYCQPCNCDADGTVSGSTCNQFGGQCQCKEHVIGRRCDQCAAQYTRLRASNPEGCDACLCNNRGTIYNLDTTCDPVTSQCYCKQHAVGLTCDQCEDTYYGLSLDNPEGCSRCDCYVIGTVGGSESCDINTGQCNCKLNTIGRTCDQCKDQFYNLSADNGEYGCVDCNCDLRGSYSSSCHNVTGQCECRLHVVGRQCSTCESGWYADDEQDFLSSGCTHQCGCNATGTDENYPDQCADIGGQCACRDHVRHRTCDQCNDNMYGFSESNEDVCLDCDCDVRGTEPSGLNTCDVISGQCECKEYVDTRTCSQCSTGYYNLSSEHIDGCLGCECYMYNVNESRICDAENGDCICVSDGGDPDKTVQCLPYVDRIHPSFGPEAGGTSITIEGGFLQHVERVYIGDFPCALQSSTSNHTHCICLTSPLGPDNEALLNTTLPISMIFPLDERPQINDTFLYKRNPNVTGIHPKKSCPMGGLGMTIKGQYLDSVYDTQLSIIMVQRVSENETTVEKFTKSCDVINDESLLCRAPKVIPPQPTSGRVRRSIDATRYRRATDDKRETYNDEDTQFFVGLEMDGVETFNNLSEALPDVGQITMYYDPKIERFTGSENLRHFRPFWWFNHEIVPIKGQRLDYAFSVKDYTVVIGEEVCDQMVLTSEMLKCVPPDVQPASNGRGSKIGDAPPVTVDISGQDFAVGYLEYEYNLWDYDTFRYSVIGGSAGLLLLIILIVAARIFCCLSKKKTSPPAIHHADKSAHTLFEAKNSKMSFISAYAGDQDNTYENDEYKDLLDLLPDDLVMRVQDCVLDNKRMTLGKVIGQGQFGTVYVGTLLELKEQQHEPVAIKTLKDFDGNTRDVAHFLEEATIMKDFDHENILNLLGVVIDGLNAYVVLPYMENGDLKRFICNEDNLLTVGDLIHFGIEVVNGMCYLEEQKFVHRDLACRNCMVNKHMHVKIADFGLSRDIYESDYYIQGTHAQLLPVKWMSLESLESGIFTSKCDVWSYGVVLWELMTRGCQPYPDVDVFDIKSYLQGGNRMDKPDFAPEDVYKLMLLCWERDADKRPTFHQVRHNLQVFVERHGHGNFSIGSTFEKKKLGSLSLQECVGYAEIQPVKANYIKFV